MDTQSAWERFGITPKERADMVEKRVRLALNATTTDERLRHLRRAVELLEEES